MTDEQIAFMIDRLDDLEERVRLLEIELDNDDELSIWDEDYEDDDLDILD